MILHPNTPFHCKLELLSNLFNIELSKEKALLPFTSHKTYVSEALHKFVYLDLIGDIETRNKEFVPFDHLLSALMILKTYKPDAYNKYIKLIRICSYDQYFGYRFEVEIATTLTHRKIEYRVSESPDFEISQRPYIGIECTSRHLNQDKSFEQTLKSIKNCIDEKSKKKYNNNGTALFVDITNLLSSHWNIIEKGNEESINTIKSYLSNSDFGNLTLFWFILYLPENQIFNSKSKLKYDCMYRRIDNENIDSRLKEFLDKTWSFGEVNPKTFQIPKIG